VVAVTEEVAALMAAVRVMNDDLRVAAGRGGRDDAALVPAGPGAVFDCDAAWALRGGLLAALLVVAAALRPKRKSMGELVAAGSGARSDTALSAVGSGWRGDSN
jgi:hypothetical protein